MAGILDAALLAPFPALPAYTASVASPSILWRGLRRTGFPGPQPRLGVGVTDRKKQNGEDENARTCCHDVAAAGGDCCWLANLCQ